MPNLRECPYCDAVWTNEDERKLKRRGLTVERDYLNHIGYHKLAGQEMRKT